ncbi:hypothetical protein TrST_g8898 [Triparma strigata]|uniref:Ankyrin repeat protein n=1 Tax=Triparma strigata TaxID=1606541 RepID=A0A9W7F0A7_9STRA|nr:hypothetical protein TrST_g8898 [Triparma strigata]
MGCANSKLNEAALSALVVSQNWDGAVNHMDEASTAEVFYQDPEDENRTALMQVLIAMSGENPPPDTLVAAIVEKASFDPREILEIKDDYSRCALHYAAMYATSVGVVELLIDKDEQCLAFETKTGSTPLMLAKERIEWKEGANGVEKGQILHALGHIPAPPPIPKEEIKVEVTDGDGDDAALSPTSKRKKFLGLF